MSEIDYSPWTKFEYLARLLFYRCSVSVLKHIWIFIYISIDCVFTCGLFLFFDLPVKSTFIPHIYSGKQQHFYIHRGISEEGGNDVTALGSEMGNKINSFNKRGFFI